jgi:hypothetical protein
VTTEPASHPFLAFAGAAALALVACVVALAITVVLGAVFLGVLV